MTFSTQGSPIWLLGTGEYQPDQRVAVLEIAKVVNGSFDSAVPIPRIESVGEAHLTFPSCNAAVLRYDLFLEDDQVDPIRRAISLRRLIPRETGAACQE
jgi:hypothetical protein